jgi:ABC-type enterochelin transport system permease subunit
MANTQLEGVTMDIFGTIKSVVRELIDLSVVLIALAIVLTILVGGSLPFVGNVVANMTGMVKDLGSNGVVGLIVLGIILWLFQSRGGSVAVARK